MVFSMETLPASLRELKEQLGVSEAVVISTCNRTELYVSLANTPDQDALIRWFCQHKGIRFEKLKPHLFCYQGGEALRHLLRVCAGLDSMILGEPQILGQAKLAYNCAVSGGTLGHLLDRAFQHAFAVAKQVRTQTAIGANPVSVAFAAVSLARQIFGELNRSTALLIGAGETIELTARHLRQQGVGHMLVANRTLERAQSVAAPHDAEAITLSEIPGHLHRSDIIIASTASPLPIIGKGSVERALKQRKHRPIFMVDMAVPRDIEAEVGKLNDAYLYTVDDLREVIEDNLRSRQAAAEQAEEIVAEQVEQFMGWVRSLEAVPPIKQLRSRAERQRDELLARAQRRLEAGDDAVEVLQYLAHTLTNTLLHAPTKGLREIAATGDDNGIKAAKRLLDISDEDELTP
ncbi:glutamyl-tRNA reductase [Alkalilimnicola ehrlichii]